MFRQILFKTWLKHKELVSLRIKLHGVINFMGSLKCLYTILYLQECIFVDSGGIIIELTSTELEDWNLMFDLMWPPWLCGIVGSDTLWSVTVKCWNFIKVSFLWLSRGKFFTFSPVKFLYKNWPLFLLWLTHFFCKLSLFNPVFYISTIH